MNYFSSKTITDLLNKANRRTIMIQIGNSDLYVPITKKSLSYILKRNIIKWSHINGFTTTDTSIIYIENIIRSK